MTPRWPPQRIDEGRRRWALAALAGGGWLAWAGSAAAAAPAYPATGDPVRWPAVQLLDGRALAAPSLQQRAAVLVFFSTTCPFCMRHNQHVQKLAAASAGLPLQVLGLAQDRSAEDVKRYLVKQGLHFDVSLDEPALRAALSPRRVIPLTCVLDRGGRLRELIPGEMFEADVLGLARWANA